MSTLLDQLVAEDGAVLRGLIAEALAEGAPAGQTFELNRFEVTIDRDAGSAVIEDLLDTGPAGTEHLPLAELVQAIERGPTG
jgi:hypothetical protein